LTRRRAASIGAAVGGQRGDAGAGRGEEMRWVEKSHRTTVFFTDEAGFF
jgi:hypothetical protein